MDSAFVRRIRFILEFRRPDQAAREAIWRRCLTTDVPLAPDVNLPFLAKRLDITGGTIQLIAVRAAFAAAAAGASFIGMTHVVGAARAELLKLGLTAAERELAVFGAAIGRRAAEVA
jgi:SpoVK/Ycf46/Vps4 family AAA+-type ATPase